MREALQNYFLLKVVLRGRSDNQIKSRLPKINKNISKAKGAEALGILSIF